MEYCVLADNTYHLVGSSTASESINKRIINNSKAMKITVPISTAVEAFFLFWSNQFFQNRTRNWVQNDAIMNTNVDIYAYIVSGKFENVLWFWTTGQKKSFDCDPAILVSLLYMLYLHLWRFCCQIEAFLSTLYNRLSPR